MELREKRQTDLGREGPESKGEQPRPLAKVPKFYFSVKKE